MAPKDPLAPFFDAVLPNGAGDQHRSKLQRSAEQLGSDAIDPPYITTMESFEGWQHSEIYAKTRDMDPSIIGDLAQACHAIVGSLPIGFGFALLKNTIAEKWEGAAADAALAATDTLAGASDQLTSGVQAIGVKLDILSSAAQDVKNSIPAPMSEQPLSLLPLTPTAAEAQEAARDAAREEAIRKLQNIYVPNYQDVGTNVPVLPAPHSPNGRIDSVDPNFTVPNSGSPGSLGHNRQQYLLCVGRGRFVGERGEPQRTGIPQGMMLRRRPRRMPKPLRIRSPGLDPARPHRLPPRMRRMRPVPVRSRAAARVPGVTVAESAEGRGPVPGDRASGVRRRARAGRTTSASPSPTRAVWFRVARSRPVAPRPAQGRLPLLQRRPR